MIDKQIFLTGMTALAGAFGREVDGPIQVAYYRVLNPKLSTEEFERAVAIALETETFWPSPAVLLGKVRQAAEAQALGAFEHVTKVMRDNGDVWVVDSLTSRVVKFAPVR